MKHALPAKPKILYLITKSNFGGAQHYVYDLATALRERDFETLVALGGTGTRDASPGKLFDLLKTAGVRTLVVEHFTRDIFLLNDFRALTEIYKIFKKEQPDIVHLNSSKAGLLGALAARAARVPIIVFTAHGWPFRESHRPLLWRLMALLGSWFTLLLSHQVISVSEFDRVAGSRLPLASGRIMTIYNGQAATTHTTQTYARASLLPQHASSAPLWIGTIGELHHNKGIDVALRALGRLAKSGTPFTYVVIGEGEERKNLEAIRSDEKLSSHVHFVGYRPDAAELCSAFDIFLLPSRKEGFPYVLLEAGAAGCAVIASEVGGIPEIILDSVTGRLVPPENTLELGAALTSLIAHTDRRAQYGGALRHSVKRQFSQKRMLEETAALYRARLHA